MSVLNPMQLMMMLKNGNPQMVVEQLISQKFSNDPIITTLYQLAKSGNTQQIEQIATQLLHSQGLDLNTELNKLFSGVQNL